MTVSIAEFWSAAVSGRLLTPDQVQKLTAQFSTVKGASTQGNARTLSEWLISQKIITRYQSTVLLSGRPGPFIYGDYRLQDRIEEGHWSGSFRAIHMPTGHPVLLQFVTSPAAQDPQIWAAISARAQANAAVVHPLVHRLFEPLDLGPYKLFVWEQLSGQGVQDVLAKAGRAPAPEAARLTWQAAIAIGHMHSCGVPHGDIRPANLWLDSKGFVHVLRDAVGPPGALDLSQADENAAWAARADYLAPEFLQPGKAPDVQTDVYALGCTLYQLLAGRPPFPGENPALKMARHSAEPAPALEPHGVLPQLAQVVNLMLAKHPGQRFPSVAMVADQLATEVDPAWLRASFPPPPRTLAAYEQFLQQRAYAPPAPASYGGGYGAALPVGMAAASVPVGVAVSAAPQPSMPMNMAAPVAASAPAAHVLNMSFDAPAAPRPGGAARPRAQRESAGGMDAQTRNIIIVAGGGVALLVLAMVAFSIMGRGDGPEDPKSVAGVNNATDPTSVKPKAVTPSKPVEVQKPKPPEHPLPAKPSGEKPAETKGPMPAANPNEPATVTVVNEGEDEWRILPWASPTSGPPLTLEYAAPDALGYFVVRPFDIANDPAAADAFRLLEPRVGPLVKQLEEMSTVKFHEIEQLVVGIHPVENQMPRYSFTVTYRAPIPPVELAKRWGDPSGAAAKGDSGAMVYSVKGFSAYQPSTAAGRVLVFGDASDVNAVSEQGAATPLLTKEIDRVRMVSDASRQFTLFLAPPRLFGDGRKAFVADREKLLGPLEKFLGDDVQALSLSGHVSGQFYLELRISGSLDSTPRDLAERFKFRIDALPKQMLDYVASIDPHPYWKTIYLRYPQMIQWLQRNTRSGPEENTVVVNCVLPVVGAANLFVASDLAMAAVPGTQVAGNDGGGATKPGSLDDVLALKTSFSVPNASMEQCFQTLSDDVGAKAAGVDFRIRILGGDLQLEGITRNQAIRDFKAENLPVNEILTALVRKANPVTTVKDPSEKDQKLVWLIGPDPADKTKNIVLITTRAAADKNKWKLPAPFLPKAG